MRGKFAILHHLSTFKALQVVMLAESSFRSLCKPYAVLIDIKWTLKTSFRSACESWLRTYPRLKDVSSLLCGRKFGV